VALSHLQGLYSACSEGYGANEAECVFCIFLFRVYFASVMRISIIGAGNVATQLALAFKQARHQIVQIANRTTEHGQELAGVVGADFTSDLSQLADADVYIMAVKDDVIEEVAAQLQLNGKLLAHTSGTKSRSLLQKASYNFGIFYPLQTMTKTAKVDFKQVPILVEGVNEHAENELKRLAKTISQNVHTVDEEQRQWIHVAAVFANNFTNHIYGISEALLQSHQLPFDILKPLIMQSVQNIMVQSPSQLQTGPAARNDIKVIDKHLQLLSDQPRLEKMYRILTDSIIATYHSGKK
jgi:predicted short-subunit dehydrogenase-like oxidoreductase (DUF2520 family)